MAVIVLFFGFLFALLSFGALCGPPIADLLRRDQAVQWWYHLPLLIPLIFLAPLPLFFLDALSWSTVEGLSTLLAALHFTLAGVCLWQGIGLALVRGLRPGGDTSRRIRTSIGAVVVLALLGVQPVVVGLVDEDYAIALAWLGIGSFAGIVWVLVLNRRGPYRLAEGKRWSAAYLVASFFQLGLFLAHILWVTDLAYPRDAAFFGLTAWVVVTGLAAVLLFGLRFLAGPLPWQPLVACSATVVTLFPPPLLYLAWQPVPPGTELPAWTDLAGNPGVHKGIERYIDCIQLHGSPPSARCSKWSQRFYAAPPALSLDQVPGYVHLLADDGKISTDGGWGYGTRVTLRSAGEQVRVHVAPDATGFPGSELQLDIGPALHAWLSSPDREEGVLMVERNPTWTVQDYISMCASWRWRCELMP